MKKQLSKDTTKAMASSSTDVEGQDIRSLDSDDNEPLEKVKEKPPRE